MRSRSLVVIVVMGVVSLAAFGLLTKLAFDNNSELRQVAEFKTAVLETFEARGVKEVSLRRLSREQGTVLRLVAEPERVRASEFLHEDIAEFYVKKFPHEGSTLTIAFVAPPRFGCSESSPFLEKEVQPQKLRAEIMARERRQRLERVLEERTGLQLVGVKRQGHNVEATLGVGSEVAGRRPATVLHDAAREILKIHRISPRGRLTIRLLSQPEPATPGDGEGKSAGEAGAGQTPVVLAEAKYDHRGREVRRR